MEWLKELRTSAHVVGADGATSPLLLRLRTYQFMSIPGDGRCV
eukprot:COSAG01_NODE_4407_length_5056_cov_4.859794_2_plen_43_part_00